METICIDTDIIIDYLKGNAYKNILPSVLNKYLCKVTPVTVYELYYGGFYTGKIKPVEDVLACLTPIIWTEKASKESAKIHVELIKKGFSLDIRDIFIASICCTEKIPLLTRNVKHFKHIKELKLVSPE
ncbi:MAG: type II toxin-antitoxin system VapC family toxin [bacterium]